ncbi:MAG TPA: SIS domain-containing protein [Solirubrobacteraceae bacterium]|nr:SIS domain-containing protein [Solirubrobacteraceae bacterium]
MSELRPQDAEHLSAAGVEPGAVVRALVALAGALRAGGKVLTFGNGGSAADAQHFAAELVGRFERERAALAAIALTTDTSALTAIANDFGFERVFARQVEALGRPGDVALAISTSGTSPNVLEAVKAARDAGMTTIGLCGASGCPLCQAVDVAIVAPAGGAARVQEAHLAVEHVLCRALEERLFAGGESLAVLSPGSVAELADLVALRQGWRATGRTVVWTNGCFDVLHAGHLASLRAARAFGDVLVVGLNSDAAVRRLKGDGRPLMPAADRAALLAALRPVDYVVVFDQDTPESALEALQPDVHCKGADYAPPDGQPIPERALVESYGGRVEFLPLLPGRSTTGFVASVQRATS